MSAEPRTIRLIGADEADGALDFPSLIAALRAGHRAGVAASQRLLLAQPSTGEGEDHLLVLAAWQRGQALGVKLASVFPANAERGMPAIASVFVLFDGETGAPLAVIDATPLTIRKTAADSALGADYLARRDARTLLMIGAGKQAPSLIEAHRVVRPGLARVLVWNRTASAAEALAGRLRAQGLAVEATTDLEAAARGADVICCATASRSPILRGAWLAPGTHVDLVGSFTPEMREADDEVICRGRLYVDSRWFTAGVAGDLVQPIRDGVIAEADIAGDLFELTQDKVPGRQSDAEITIFKNGGGGHLDLMAARLVYERAGRTINRGDHDAATR
ncbi:MAG TPA: ornithine cyclodeaminase family protein [Acetobacteraceae bacterium]|nr:ornithine cyclodeaminase family protein [Acetobacteraceae bacterium]